MDGSTTHAKGLVITLLGVVVMSPDSLLIRLVEADQWTLLFWRGLLMAIGIMAGLALVYRGAVVAHVRAIGRVGAWMTVQLALGTLLFILAITNTSVANTLFILSTSPLFSAIMARLFLGERVCARTWLAILCALAGIAVIVLGSLSSGEGELLGDLAALATAIVMAGSFTLIRHSRARSMVPAMGLSGFLVAAAALPLGALPATVSGADLGFLLLMGLVVLPISFSLVTLGPRYIPAPEVSLVMLLEAVLGPFWVWLAIGEQPGDHTLVGGAIVLATLAAHSAVGLYRVGPAPA